MTASAGEATQKVQTSTRRGIVAGLTNTPVWAIAVLCLWGLLTNWQITRPWSLRMWSGVQDFTALYAGGRLAGSGDLYNSTTLRALEYELTGVHSADYSYVRLPVVALAWKPLSLIPYPQAMLLWKTLSIAGFLALAWILPWPQKKVSMVALALSLGAWNTLLQGQDVWLSILLIAASLRFMSQERDRAAGIALGLAVVLKYHIFPFAILALIVQKKWRMLAASGAVVLIAAAACFAVQGPRWPIEYVQVLLRETAAKPQYMPNLGGLAALTGMSVGVYLALVAAASIAIAAIARRAPVQFSFGIALFAGVLLAPHGYAYDFTILLPALLPLAARHTWFEAHCAWWITPFPLLPVVMGFGVFGQFFVLMTAIATLYAASQFSTKEMAA